MRRSRDSEFITFQPCGGFVRVWQTETNPRVHMRELSQTMMEWGLPSLCVHTHSSLSKLILRRHSMLRRCLFALQAYNVQNTMAKRERVGLNWAILIYQAGSTVTIQSTTPSYYSATSQSVSWGMMFVGTISSKVLGIDILSWPASQISIRVKRFGLRLQFREKMIYDWLRVMTAWSQENMKCLVLIVVPNRRLFRWKSKKVNLREMVDLE